MIDWQQVHDQFPINRKLTWLNNCGISSMPGPVLAKMQAHLQALAEGGVTGVPSEEAVHASARTRLSRLIGADVDELTLIHHTNEGLTFISHGLDLAPGDRLVVLEHEYPSNVYPWQHWQDRGVQIAFAPLADTPERFLDGLRPLLQPPTRVVSLSAVHWCTGLPLPLVEIGRLCAERDVLLVVDGAQGVGLVDIDVRAAGIAAMAFSAWKWLLGPIGLGALYLRRDLIDRLRFPFKGTGSVIDDHNHLPYRDALKPGADRYVLSTPNYNDWVHFDASLEYLEGLGHAAVRGRIRTLAARLADRLRAAGYALAADAFPGQANGIVSAVRQGLDAPKLAARLQQHGVVAAARLGRLRLSPHVYLSEAQLDRAADLIVAQDA
jgi:cysteine desulfurase/selenocysteine lyase